MHRLKGYAQSVVTAAKKETLTAAVEDTATAFVSTVLTDGTYLILGVAAVAGSIDIISAPMIAVLAQAAFSSVESMLQYRIQKRKCLQAQAHLGQFTRNYTQTVKRAADNKRRYAPGWVHSTGLLRGCPKGAAPPLALDFAEQSVVCYTLCRRCPENTVAAGEGKGI